MKKNGSASAVAPAGAARLKSATTPMQESRANFLSRWIAYGMALKAKADGYGIDWRGKEFQTWIYEIGDADMFAEHKGEAEHA